MALHYFELEKHPSMMTADELRQEIPIDADMSVIMRSLLMAELAHCRKHGVERRTLRRLWYVLIKPAISKMSLLDPAVYESIPRRGRKADKRQTAGDLTLVWSSKLSIVLAELVRIGAMTYADLGIVDGSRQRRPAMTFDYPTQTVQLVGVHYPNIIIFTEKDTIYDELYRLASIYGISAISGSGQPSLACTENLVDQIEKHYPEDSSVTPLYFLGVTDYDPSGYTIYEAQFEQLKDVTTTRGWVSDIKPIRLGLTPDQLTADELINNTYQPPAKGLNKWFNATGGVNGQPLGLELDALPLERVRALFVTGINSIIDDERIYHDDIQNALKRLVLDEVLSDVFDDMRESVLSWADERLPDLLLDGDIVRGAALDGRSFVDPYAVFDDGTIAKVKQRMRDGARVSGIG